VPNSPNAVPVVTDDGSCTLYSSRYSENYHSHFGAISESRLVYLETSGIAARLSAGFDCSVLELGFGLGLNFLLTADLALQQSCKLSYTAYENDLISESLFLQLDYINHLSNPALVEALAGIFTTPKQTIEITHRKLLTDCDLILHHADISQAQLPVNQFDAIYLDAFSPDTNPECWTKTLFEQLYNCMKPGGVLVTYSVKGRIRRDLSQVGFSVIKCPGPTGKREILRACAHKSLQSDSATRAC